MLADRPALSADQPTNPNPKLRWFNPTPGRLLVILLAVEGVLLLSEKFQWFGFNEHKGWTVLIAIASVGVTMVFMLLWFILALIFHWHFQFSIRWLLVLTVVVAIPCSWLAVEMRWAKEQKEAVEAIVKLGSVYYEDSIDLSVEYFRGINPVKPAWIGKLLGEDFFRNVTALELNGSKITDGELENIKELKQLKTLQFAQTKITDAGLVHLKGLTTLESLDISNTNVTDDGIKGLQKVLPNLKIYR
jgi:Leucine-rich repeat (LRR) protein